MTTGTLPRSPSSSLSSDKKVCIYGQDHAEIEEWAMHSLGVDRTDIGIEEPWSALVRVVCPSPLSRGQKAFEASIEWDSEVWFARITLVCNLPFLLRRWALTHEILELKHWKTGDAFHNLLAMLPPSELRDLLQHQFYAVRNQEIEQEVGQYLGYRRPNHIVSSPLVVKEKQEEESKEMPLPPEGISLMTPEEFLGSLGKTIEETVAGGEPWADIVTITEKDIEDFRL